MVLITKVVIRTNFSIVPDHCEILNVDCMKEEFVHLKLFNGQRGYSQTHKHQM
jgi:hypothetical protein